MSIWDDNFDENLDKDDFEAWLDYINESGDPDMDEDYYNEVQAKEWEELHGKYEDNEYERWLDDNIDDIYENDIMNQCEYPEFMVKGNRYIMTVSNN